MKTVLFEFVSRGLMWLRVLLLGAVMPLDAYGLTLIYLGIESLLAATTSYPFIKDVLVRQELKPSVYRRFFAFFALVSVPAMFAMMYLGDTSLPVAGILLAAALLNGVSQIALYVLRVADVRAHNRAKIIWSVLTTLLFLGLLPLNWVWLPIVYLAGALTVLLVARSAVATSEVGTAQEVDLAHHLWGWLIYGTQALMLSLPQHGMRLVVAATMTYTDVARFTQVYMLATALFFIYSAIMISVEAELSRSAPPNEIRGRFRKAYGISALVIVVAAVHYGAMLLIDVLKITDILFDFSLRADSTLLFVLIVFTALSGLRVVANALALAASGRSFSLLATFLGALILGVGLVILMPVFGLAGVGFALALGQAAEVAVLVVFVLIATRSSIRSRSS